MTALKRAVLSWLRLAPPPHTPHVYLIGSHPLNSSRPHPSLVWLAKQFPRHVHAIGSGNSQGKGVRKGRRRGRGVGEGEWGDGEVGEGESAEGGGGEGGMLGGGVDVTYDGVTKMNSLFALAMGDRRADVAGVIDPDVVLLGDVMAAVARLTWQEEQERREMRKWERGWWRGVGEREGEAEREEEEVGGGRRHRGRLLRKTDSLSPSESSSYHSSSPSPPLPLSPRWILTSSLWRVSWFPFVLDNLPPEIQPANHKPPAGVDEAELRKFLRQHAELDSGGPIGFVMWSQRQFREASSVASIAAQQTAAARVAGAGGTRGGGEGGEGGEVGEGGEGGEGEGEAAGNVAAFNRNGLRVSLFSEPMPPFLYGRGPQGWQWVLRQLAWASQRGDSTSGGDKGRQGGDKGRQGGDKGKEQSRRKGEAEEGGQGVEGRWAHRREWYWMGGVGGKSAAVDRGRGLGEYAMAEHDLLHVVGRLGREEGKVGGVSREGVLHVVDGTGAASAIRIDPQYDSVKEAERARGSAEQGRRMGGGDGERGRSGRWMGLPAVHGATWHGQVNEMLLRGGVGDWGAEQGERSGEGRWGEGAVGDTRKGDGGEATEEEGRIAWEWAWTGGEPTVAHLRWHVAMCHGPGGEMGMCSAWAGRRDGMGIMMLRAAEGAD
ncbi:unnamed protein product [Closterium sp. NIES-54]